MDSSELNPHVLEVADRIGDFIEYWGFKKIQGKIWALIYLAERPVDANYLIRNLKVSKALVSMSLKVLQEYNVILEDKEKRSTIHYVINKDITRVILDVLAGREAKMLLQIKSACELLGRVHNDKIQENASKERVDHLVKMVDVADNLLGSFLKLRKVSLDDLDLVLTMNGI